jgi:hypothetical protein
MHGSEWCVGHDPNKAEARRLRASKGGRSGGRGRPRAELADVKRRLSDLADDVLEGRKDRGNAAVVGQLLNTYIRAVGVEMKVREVEDLERRLEELEGALKSQKGGRRGA